MERCSEPTCWPPHAALGSKAILLVTATAPDGTAALSIPFEVTASSPPALSKIQAASSPWEPDGLVVGAIPSDDEEEFFGTARKVRQVAQYVAEVERSFVKEHVLPAPSLGDA